MSWVASAVAGAGVVGSIYTSEQQRRAGNRAASAQERTAQLGIDEQRRQFDALQSLLQPYVGAGTQALGGMLGLAGLNGADAQAQAIASLQQSPMFTSAMQQGNEAIMQNAAATGGLRGGNTQAALAQFAPSLLSATINDQYSRLGGIASMGQSSAAGVGNAGMGMANNVSQLLQQQGAAQAGAYLNSANSRANMVNGIIGSGAWLAGAKF